MPEPRVTRPIITFFSLVILSLVLLFFTTSSADSRTIVLGGAVTANEHVRLTNSIAITGLNPALLSGANYVTINVPVYSSGSVSGFSQTVSGFGITASPTTASAPELLTDDFGNSYYHYVWPLEGYTQSDLAITVTTDFDCTVTGSPTPETFSDPYPLSSPGMAQFLQSTAMAQADNDQIRSKAQSLVAGTTTEAAAVENIMDFIKVNVNTAQNNYADAVHALSIGSSNCTNRANLALALLRSAGIPARIVEGIVSNQQYRVDFIVPEGAGYMETGWYAQEPHAWVEVYFPEKGAWVGYDPYLNFGFVDQRHVKAGIAVDSDDGGKTTTGLGNRIDVNLPQGSSVMPSFSVAFSQISDAGTYTFRSMKESPGGTDFYVLGRDMVNAPTPTPTATPTPSPEPTVTPTPTAISAPNATVTPAPAPTANATVTPVPSPAAPTINPDANLTVGTGNSLYNFSGTVTDAVIFATMAGATLTFDGQPFPADAQGAFTIAAANGTHTLTVSAPGYDNVSLTLTIAGADVVQNLRLSPVAGNSQAKTSGTTPGFELIIALAGLLIIALYRHGRT